MLDALFELHKTRSIILSTFRVLVDHREEHGRRCAHLLQQALGCRVQVRVRVAKAVDERAQEAWREHQRHMVRPAAVHCADQLTPMPPQASQVFHNILRPSDNTLAAAFMTLNMWPLKNLYLDIGICKGFKTMTAHNTRHAVPSGRRAIALRNLRRNSSVLTIHKGWAV